MNYQSMTWEQLLEVWKGHRNDMVGYMAAEEIMRRLSDGRLTVTEG
jgi:hypothetical protein